MLSMQNAGMLQNMGFQKDRMKDLLKQADDMAQIDQLNAAHVWPDATTEQHDSSHGRRNARHSRTYSMSCGSHFGFRGFLEADPQLFLLGKALL